LFLIWIVMIWDLERRWDFLFDWIVMIWDWGNCVRCGRWTITDKNPLPEFAAQKIGSDVVGDGVGKKNVCHWGDVRNLLAKTAWIFIICKDLNKKFICFLK
jgi:hypothetical protein